MFLLYFKKISQEEETIKTIKEITSYYQRSLRAPLLELEIQRKAAKIRVNTLFFPQAIAIVAADIYFLSDAVLFVHIIVLLLGLGFSYALTAIPITKSYVKNFKLNIITPLIKFIDKSLVYRKEKFVNKETFIASKINREKITQYSGKDFVYGNIDGVNVKFSELHVDGGDDNDMIFSGLFISAEFPKHFKAHTIVHSKKGRIFYSLKKEENYETIEMDSPAFNSEFVVHSTDQIEARYILSHTLMERIMAYNKDMEYSTTLSFVDGNIYIANMCGEILRPALQRSLLDFNIAKSYALTLHFAASIVEALKLDLKLWSKY